MLTAAIVDALELELAEGTAYAASVFDLSGGRATHELGQDPAQESGQTQFFLAVDPDALTAPADREQMMEGIIAALKAAPGVDGAELRYPGEGTVRTREENLARGLPVRAETWEALRAGS